MTARLRFCVCIAVVSTGVALLLSPSVAPGAVPAKNGNYRGKTSQGLPVNIEMTRRARIQDIADGELRTQCVRVGRVDLFAGHFGTRVARSGRFRSTSILAESAFTGPVLDDGGTKRRLFDVTRFELSGRFVSRRRVRGQWRAHSMLFPRSAFFSGEGQLDRCDTGVLTWSARLRRR